MKYTTIEINKYRGLLKCLQDRYNSTLDNTVRMGSRSGKSFGRFDENNPRVSGPNPKANPFLWQNKAAAMADDAKTLLAWLTEDELNTYEQERKSSI